MFEFEAELESLEKVPSQYQGLYVKDEAAGKFNLDPELAKRLDTSGLTTALDKERKASREAAKTLSSYQKFGKLEEIQARLEAAEKGSGVNVEKLKADMLAAHTAELSERDGSIQKMRSSLERHLIDAEAATALSEHKGSSMLLLPHVRDRVKVVEENGEFVARVVDAEGDPRGNGKGGFMSIKDLVVELKKNPEFARAFESSGTSGGGTRPGGNKGGTPGSMSATEKIAAGLAGRTS